MATKQAELDAFADPDSCEAVAIRSGERCGRRALTCLPYCYKHIDLLTGDQKTD